MNGGAVLIDENVILTVGGAHDYGGGNASPRAYLINISSPVPFVERLPDMMWPRAFVNLVLLPNGWVVVAGGQRFVAQFSDSDPVLFVEIYDPVAKVFRELDVHLMVARNYHSTAVLAKDGRVVVGGSGLCGGSCDYETPYVRTQIVARSQYRALFVLVGCLHSISLFLSF
jgi:galactose oxidase